MMRAVILELVMLGAFLGSHDARSRTVGVLAWVAYLYFSATWAALQQLVEWLDDQNNPPPTP